MNKKIIAIGLASALAMTASISSFAPTALTVSAADEQAVRNENIVDDENEEGGQTKYEKKTVSPSGVGIEFRKEVLTQWGYETKKSQFSVQDDDDDDEYGRLFLRPGDKITAIVKGTIVTVTTNYLSNEDIPHELEVAHSVKETYSYKPIGLSDLYDWESSDTSVATVENGVVTAVAVGHAEITAKYKYTDENNVEQSDTVSAPISVVAYDPENSVVYQEVDLEIGATFKYEPKLFKGTISSDENSVKFKIESGDFGDDAKWDDKGEVYSGSIASFNKKTGEFVAKAPTYSENHPIILEAEVKDTEGLWSYGFCAINIVATAGTTVKDYDNTGNYKILNSEEVAFASPIGTPEKVVIPGKVIINERTYKVVEIGEGAFAESSVKSVRFPESIKKIGAKAFYKCKKMKRFIIAGTDVEEIGESACEQCTKLEEVVIDASKVKKIGSKAFKKTKKKCKYRVSSSSNKEYKKFVKKLKKAKAKGEFIEES